MIRAKEIKPTFPIIIDLTGPQGNAYALLGLAHQLGKLIGMEAEDIEHLQTEMQSGDYEHLLETFDAEFGELVILER